MTTLDALINGLTDDAVTTSNALRKVLVVGKRLRSSAIVDWANHELNGFGNLPVQQFPSYRGPLQAPVEVLFVGYGGSWAKHFITRESVPDDGGFRKAYFDVYFNEPIAELENLSRAERDASQRWPTDAVAQLQRWSEEGRAPQMEMHGIHSVEKIIPRSMLHGVIDSVRNKALMLALDLQDEFPQAGEVGGPTVDDTKVGQVVNLHFNNTFHGGTNSVAQGENVNQTVTVGQGESVNQTVTVQQGDSEALMLALEKIGLALEDRQALGEALEKDGNKPGNAVMDFLKKLGTGVIKIAGTAAANPAITMVKAAITGFTGIPIP